VNAAQPLLQPYRMGEFELTNRVVMAPLTRCRATNPDLLPTELHVRYYGQRASAGLIITEGTWISRDAVGWHDVPGLFNDAQVRAWSAVTDAVHRRGGLIFVQLWHTGSSSHPDFFAGTAPLAPSAVNPGVSSPTPSGNKPTVAPRAMTRDDIRTTISDYATAAANAMRAGFDGVQLQAGFNYLISQFLNPRTNVRTDDYGDRSKTAHACCSMCSTPSASASKSAGWASRPGRRGVSAMSSFPLPTLWPPPSTWSTGSTITRWRTGC
jgi:N-ethylmaleimide reductase